MRHRGASGMVVTGLVPLIVVVPLIVFWARMFRDMTRNASIPEVFRPYWTAALILLNIPAAIFYYYVVYKDR